MQPLEGIPPLETSYECVHIVEYGDLDKLIKRVYGIFETPVLTNSSLGYRSFSIVSMEEWQNDQSHEFTVKREPLDRWRREELREFMEDPFRASYKTWVLLNDLCNNGYIEPGTYIIRVYW